MSPLLLLAAAFAQTPDHELEPLADTLREEIRTNMQELRLENSPEIYLLRYKLMQLDTASVEAHFGGLTRSYRSPSNALGVEVRIADPQWDNTGMVGWQNGFASMGLPDALTPRSLQLAAWRLTDGSYKEAVEQYARKVSKAQPPPDHPGDYLVSDGRVHRPDLGSGGLLELETLEGLATQLSGHFAHRGFTRGEVHIGQQFGSRWTLDSEGTDVRTADSETTVRALAQTITDDGMRISDAVLWSVPDSTALPPIERMEAEVDQLVARIEATAKADPFDEEYVGPVWLGDGAAAEFFRYLLLPQLQGTPQELSFDTWFGEMTGEAESVRMGRRVLPPGWTVVADPQHLPAHVSSYTHDDEGTPSERVALVEDGIVRDLLMSRVPRKDKQASNGHGRSSLDTRAEGNPAQVLITAPKAVSDAAMHRRAVKLAGAYGRDWYVKVERLQVPATLDDASAGVFLFGDGDGPNLPHPVQVLRVAADGTETVLRGAAFSGIQRYLLRDIAAVGGSVEHTWMNNLENFGATPTSGLPAWISANEVLVGEMELVPMPGDPNDAPLLTAPK